MNAKIISFFTLFIFTYASLAEEHKKTKACVGHKHEEPAKVHDKEEDHTGHDHDKAKEKHVDKEEDHTGHNHDKAKEKHVDKEEDHTDNDHEADKDDHEDEKSTGITLNSKQLKAVNLTISTAASGDLKTKIFLPGEVKFNRDRMAQIMPRMPGFVIKIFKKEGDQVNKGDKLAELQSHKLGELFAEYQSAKDLETKARAEFEIKNKLWGKKAISEVTYIGVRQAYAKARVSRHQAEDKLTSLGLKPQLEEKHSHEKSIICTSYLMKSPIKGTIIKKKITIGENYSEDNTEVPFVVADLSTLWLDLNARQSDLPKLKKGQKVDVKFGEGFPDFHGEIAYIAPDFQPATRTVLVRVILQNKNGLLKPGLYATGVVSLRGKSQKVVVPRAAVILVAGEKVIFVPKGKNFIAVPAITGRSSNGFIEVLSGLKTGEKYVSNGAFELKAIMITSGMDPHAGHGH